MAVDYARDNQLLSTMELQELPIKVREGDLSLIMHAYEYNMRSPVKNMVGGDMLRLILIQVQKAKVDLGTAMQALDKLLRANQLNFAFLAVLPTLFLLGGAWGALSRLIKRRRGLGRGKLHRRLFRSLREIEKLLLLDEPTTTNLYTSLGRLLIETYLLHQMASVHLPTADGLREMFTEDLSAIESLQLRTSQKLAILQRMKQTLDIYLRQ
jgi:nuclear-control-of-ATPase protein 2